MKRKKKDFLKLNISLNKMFPYKKIINNEEVIRKAETLPMDHHFLCAMSLPDVGNPGSP